MGLLQLLSVNQTLLNVKNAPSAYHLTKQNWLPQFGTEPDFSPTDESGSVTPQPTVEVTGEPKKPQAARPHFRSSVRSKALPQQTEFSLDTVQVICNDLSDSDFEVFPQAKGGVRMAPKASVVIKAAHPGQSQAGWSWWTRRFFSR
jgi:hypothetical protein